MKSILQNVLAVVLGLVIGSVVNMGLVVAGPHVIPPPPGIDVNSVESMRAGIHLFEPKHFVFPFLAHAFGTFAGALVAGFIATRGKRRYPFIVGAAFLAGGIAAATMIPAPKWFIALDLIVAYLPMAWLATRLVGGVPAGKNS